MKKFIKKILLVLGLITIPAIIFAQDGGDTTTGFDIMSLFTTYLGYVAGIVTLTGLLTTYVLKNLSKIGRSILSWVIAALVGFAGWFLKLGIFSGIEWYMVLVIVVSFAMGSNVIYNVEWLRNLLSMLKILPVKKA